MIYEEIETLKPNKPFCGALIEVFPQEIGHNTDTFALSSYFLLKLKKSGVDFAKRCIRKSLTNIMSCARLLVPVSFVKIYWGLEEVDKVNQAVRYYDSLRYDPEDNLTRLKEFCIAIDYLTQHATFEVKDVFAHQTNLYDCGVFVCKHGRCLIQGKDLNFGQDDMNFVRQNIKETLLKSDKFKGQQLESHIHY